MTQNGTGKPFGEKMFDQSFFDELYSNIEKATNEEFKEMIKAVSDRLEYLIRKIDLIFGNHVLIDGRFVDISKHYPD